MKNQSFPKRCSFALHGLTSAWRQEKSLRTHSLFGVGALVMLIILQPAPVWWALILIMVFLVLAAELINSALEQLADHLHPEQHPNIKLVKDCAAAAVLLLSLAAVLTFIAMLIDLFA